MGPSTVKYLGLDQSTYTGDKAERASEEQMALFQEDLLSYIHNVYNFFTN